MFKGREEIKERIKVLLIWLKANSTVKGQALAFFLRVAITVYPWRVVFELLWPLTHMTVKNIHYIVLFFLCSFY